MQTIPNLAIALNELDMDYSNHVYRTRLEALLVKAGLKLFLLMIALFSVITVLSVPALMIPAVLSIVAGVAYTKMVKQKESAAA